jgi:hypothetical protein
MTKIDKVLTRLSDLYEFNRELKAYELKEYEKADKRVRPVTEKADSR